MGFSDYLLKDFTDETERLTRGTFQVTSPSEKLVLHTAVELDGKEERSWNERVLARDLDPDSLAVEKPDSRGLRHLRVHCHFYRSVITSAQVKHYRGAILRLPLAKIIPSPNVVKSSFRELLVRSGARPVSINRQAVQGVLEPLQQAAEPAGRTAFSPKDEVSFSSQSFALEVKGCQILLIRRIERRHGREPHLKPVEVQTASFELLSMDSEKTEIRMLPDLPGTWEVSLYSLGRLQTTGVKTGSSRKCYRLWYWDLYFPGAAEANQFASTCANAVQELRERLYQFHRSG